MCGPLDGLGKARTLEVAAPAAQGNERLDVMMKDVGL